MTGGEGGVFTTLNFWKLDNNISWIGEYYFKVGFLITACVSNS
jgi:hypothetical protein